MPKSFRGLTLIELLIIIVIIGILLAVAIPKFGGRRDKERLGELRTDIRNAQRAEDAYFDQFKGYASVEQLRAAHLYNPSIGDSVAITLKGPGYSVNAVNSVDPENVQSCSFVFPGGSNANGAGFECH
ncbi:MAG TPA: prepilin-type N-terminal cleavage/methylation domain-containing protein [Gemmatimonadales bacterium]|jgi:type II secretory pathway pseudopilin PulG